MLVGFFQVRVSEHSSVWKCMGEGGGGGGMLASRFTEARYDQANLSPMLEGEGSIPGWGGGFSSLIINYVIRFSNWLSGVFPPPGYCEFLSRLLGKGPFTCIFKLFKIISFPYNYRRINVLLHSKC